MKIQTWHLVYFWSLFCMASGQSVDTPRGPWELVFKVVGGNWDSGATGYSTFMDLFYSSDTYNTADPVPHKLDLSSTSDHYKSGLIEDWQNGIISVQAIKMSLFKDNVEKQYIVFDGSGKTKTTWFKCDNILYSSYDDLPDNTLPTECPGKNAGGLPLTIMKLSYFYADCWDTTGWFVVADTSHTFSICPGYMPAHTGSVTYFKYAIQSTVGDLTTELETADSMAIFFQVWDLVFKGIEGIKPSAAGLNNLTGLFTGELTENDNSDSTVRNLLHTQSSQTFKSGVVNLWGSFYIDTVKYSMYKSAVEKAFVVFDGINGDKETWFHEDNMLYSSYSTALTEASIDICSIEGDTYRNWQIQNIGDVTDCTNADQMGWMLVKEPGNNGSCAWDFSILKRKPYFLYNTGTTAANPSTFQYADVMAVFVHGWRLVLKASSGGDLSTSSSIYSLWTDTGSLNEDIAEAASIDTTTTYKSSIIDQWNTYYIRAVKLALYKDGLEVFNVIFDATASTNMNWFDCNRVLYTSVSGLDPDYAADNSYICGIAGISSTFRFLIGTSTDCGTVSATGVLAVIDADSTCSSSNDLPQFLYSNTLDSPLSESTSSMLADTFAIFVDMPNCYTDTCSNGATCQDLGGQYRCFCAGSYYGDTCTDLDGTYGEWSGWSACSVTCESGVTTRSRTCTGTEGNGVCVGDDTESTTCTLDNCPINGGLSEWTAWGTCSQTCGEGTQSRSRDCTNPSPQYGGADCTGDTTETQSCPGINCPINGGLSEWTAWGICSHTCGEGTQSRSRDCTHPSPQFGGADCTGITTDTQSCPEINCPINGGFSGWTAWGTCSQTCGEGTQSRSRDCTNPSPQYGGADCAGETTDTQSCPGINCPINGGLSEWTAWGICSHTCGEGTRRSRTRDCTNPSPQYGGTDCTGDTTETLSCPEINCPINGGLSDWTAWGTCSQTCGEGTHSRSRDCTNPSPQYGGADCTGETTETQSCPGINCPINGGFSEWTAWGTCSHTCGEGTQSRSRDCTNPSPQYGGADCTGVTTDTQSCPEINCPINGGFSDWTAWGICSQTCGEGTQSRSRDCTNPSPQYGGADCTGATTETQSCPGINCPINGGLSEWTEWGTCSQTCDEGTQSRSRDCTNPSPQYGGADCNGDTTEIQFCPGFNCPINGGLSEWTAWGTCSQTCGEGTQSRSRDCTNPSPQYGGTDCTGLTTDTQSCPEINCPINGGFSDWTAWGTCSQTCGEGTMSRSRDCTNPSSQYGGADCTGETTETQSCPGINCPINGGLSEWTAWGTCSQTCGEGTQSRIRDCTNPSPQYGGTDCTGDTTETHSCPGINCPINGGFTEWSAWGTCSQTCGEGTQSRSRDCTNPSPQYGGADCTGVTTDTQSCPEINCPINGGISEWTTWGTCSQTCGEGTQSRLRDCTNPSPQYGGADCTGHTTETQSCPGINCPINGGLSEWTEWDTCSHTCGEGTQSRSRDCTNPSPQYGGTDCTGDTTDTQSCPEINCPINGGYTDWTVWGTCSYTCGEGTQSRSRDCTNPSPQYGGTHCTGVTTDTQSCPGINCPIDGGFSDWAAWGTCSHTYGEGTQSRSRDCTNPNPQYGGADCTEETTESQPCTGSPCPVNGGLSDWTTWGICSHTCGEGTQSRSRDCTNPSPQYGGADCTGDMTDMQSCTDVNCPIDGGFSGWTAWGTCSQTCGEGTQFRARGCTNPSPQYGGADCGGLTTDTRSCLETNCPVDGGLSEWTAWGTCSHTCGEGTLSRTRDCTNPNPQYGGAYCTGDSTESQPCTGSPCPVDGGLSQWTTWGTCSQTCGEGTQSRTRDCTNPSPQYGGADCTGDTIDTQSCTGVKCPINGGLSEWTAWDTCSQTCGEGTQSRTRDCTNPSPQYGGADCTGDTTQSQPCTGSPCPVDGGLSQWTTWGTCSEACGEGTQSRSRDCTNPSPQYGGADCTGDTIDTQSCTGVNCPINGGFSDWTGWGICSHTCGAGIQSRSRDCTNPSPQYGGADCTGDTTESQPCNGSPCPVDGGLSGWTTWGICSQTCGEGTQYRSRDCTNPNPQYGGADCTGDTTESLPCTGSPCPVDGGLSQWTAWGTCSQTCGEGTQYRSRDCTNPSPQYGGADCTGDTIDTQSCTGASCPINGGFSDWTVWGICSQTCGAGMQSRTRDCTNPSPQFGGADCAGDTAESQPCTGFSCPVDGGLSQWTTWGTCSEACGEGTQSRSRDCTNPSPQYGGTDCTGDTIDTQSCTGVSCPIDGGFSEWTAWGTCSHTCGEGTQSRSRDCTNPSPQYGGTDCTGDTTETQPCPGINCLINGGLSEWTAWGTCSQTCGEGTQSRSRDCTNPSPQYGGADCTGVTTDSQSCPEINCSLNGGFTEWTVWGTCSQTCGDGTQSRSRDCTKPSPQYGGVDCTGDTTETQSCPGVNCPINGGLTDWTTWGICSHTCGEGTQSRSRDCANPSPQYGGADCTGATTETQSCTGVNCPIDGGFSDWTAWGTCSHTCGEGTQSRSRDCTNPSPQYGGADCTGETTDTQDCIASNCPIDGGYSDWSEWSACSATCGDGIATRSRDCTNPTPAYGGAICADSSTETQSCSDGACAVDGGYTSWSEWSVCSITCGDGIATRSRDCTNPTPAYGGSVCADSSTETQPCSDGACAVDGGYTDWSEWSVCSATCGDGIATRSRDCTNPTPAYGGAICTDSSTETQSCSDGACAVVSGFGAWNEWSTCSVACGSGTQDRSRTCENPGYGCVGDTEGSRECNGSNCPVDGGYTAWSEWSVCSATCGDGIATRSRDCTNPTPAYGGSMCADSPTETQSCIDGACAAVSGFGAWSEWGTCSVTCGSGTQDRSRVCENPDDGCDGVTEGVRECSGPTCPVNGGYSEWTEWGSCSVTCGDGTQTRSRDCNNPVAAFGGDDCEGSDTDTKGCTIEACPVDGYWTDWEEWTVCTVSCDTGTRTRSRTCVEPQYGGDPCVGSVSQQVESCMTQNCPVDGQWEGWGTWSGCGVTCGGGTMSRTRICTGVQYGGLECPGEDTEHDACNESPCPIDGYWMDWSEWNTCTMSCNTGTQNRERICAQPQYGGQSCTGATAQTQYCNTDPCPVDGYWLPWQDWTSCTVACDGGTRDRSRTCVEPQHGGLECSGVREQLEDCNTDPCPVDGYWTSWSEWGSCSVSCSDGVHTRSRTCVGPFHSGADCNGEDTQSMDCNEGDCPVNGVWAEWSEWSACTQSCGGGTHTKERTCIEPENNGEYCEGEFVETDTCNVHACPVDGVWSVWSVWTSCTRTCGVGSREKNRTCTEPLYGGKFCIGEIYEKEVCNSSPCEVDWYWSTWSDWSVCTRECGGGTSSRTRTCVHPLNGGEPCPDVDIEVETESCNTQPCSEWTVWSSWSDCSATCNGGSRNRSRTCTQLTTGHYPCIGHSVDIALCGFEICPSVDGGWSGWSEWTLCSVSCGSGERIRVRTCTEPYPQWNGRYCDGIHVESDYCVLNQCPVDGGWAAWSSWSPCFNMTSPTCSENCDCGWGTSVRYRTCDNPPPQLNGRMCDGDFLTNNTCRVPCYKIKCSDTHPEACQVILNLPGASKENGTSSLMATYSILLIVCLFINI